MYPIQALKRPYASKYYLFLFNLKLLLKTIRREVSVVYIFFFITSVLLISLYKKQTLHLLLNKFNSSFFDVLFKYATFLGDGIMFGILALLFVFIKRRMFWVFGISGALTLLVTHLLKKIMFKGIPRPAGDFGLDNLHIVEGVKMAFSHSFPSGHTMTAFAIFTILCLYFKKCKSQYIWMLLAIVAGLSRVYLSQHYWIDIFVGSILGILVGFISFGLLLRNKPIH